MITLTTERGFERVESWDDVQSLPGFVTDVDPRTATLETIIGSYSFATFLPCGLSSCHTLHGHGYLVKTSDGRVTNIGKDCGKKYFSVDFQRMAKTYDRDLRAQERRETILALQHQIPAIMARVRALKDEHHGGTWIHRNLALLTGASSQLPTDIQRLIHRLVTQRNGALTKSRRATEDEIERMRAQGQRIQPGETFVEETVGQLEGLPALYKENNLRDLLVVRMAQLEIVEAADVSSLTGKELRDLAQWAATIEPTLARAEAAISAGRRFLTQANLGQLAQFLSSKNEKAALNSFLQQLPM